MKHVKDQKGFTLIEMLVVVIIVAALAAIAVPIYLSYVEGARATEAQTAISSIWTASKVYRQEHGLYPADMPTLIERAGNAANKVYVNIEEATMRNWTFAINGGGSETKPQSIEAISTAEMPGGAGKTVRYNIIDGRWEGYGTESDAAAEE